MGLLQLLQAYMQAHVTRSERARRGKLFSNALTSFCKVHVKPPAIENQTAISNVNDRCALGHIYLPSKHANFPI